jgi:P-type Ca2+ transporter type 2C
VLDNPHGASVAEVERALGSDSQRGLSADEAARRLEELGPNRLTRRSGPGYVRIAARQLADPLVLLLVAAASVSFAIGEEVEAAVIAAIVVLNAVLGFVQEAGAERAVLALGESLEQTAAVVRDGEEREVALAEVVPGDLLVLREGDRVGADARVVRARGLEVDESALTGESLPVEKSAEPCSVDAPLAERRSVLHAGTGVTRGRTWALVTATGDRTEIGRVAELTATATPPPTPLQRSLGRLSRVMVVVGLGVTAALTAGMLARGESLDEAFLLGVSVAVAAVPEGLAATVTIALAQGARAMAGRGAIVRRLAAVETLGAAAVIAADKTGTLTENRLRVAEAHPLRGRSETDLLELGALASVGELVDGEDGMRAVGDPVDGAFLLAAHRATGADPRSASGRRLVREHPFDPERKRVTAVYDENGRLRLVSKGAPEVLFDLARVDGDERGALEALLLDSASRGLRVLAVGEREVGSEDEDDAGLELAGLVALRDPLRAGAADSVAQARAAGVSVAVLTGDHVATATAIGQELGFRDGAVTGAELDEAEPDALPELVSAHEVYARVTPAHKLRLVDAFQRRGEVVAVTGDGINDAPALRQADVGLAMGKSGTEAAREAAEIVLTDDDFATILAAIREGRRIQDNLRKFVLFLLSANFGEVVLFALAVLAGIGVPMTVVQILVVNLLTDGLPAVALTLDPASPRVMERGPRRSTALFTRQGWAALAGIGVVVGLVATAAYLVGREVSPETGQTMAFATVALSELVLVWSIRSSRAPAWRGERNRVLAASVAASAAIVAAVLYVPALAELTGTVALEVPELALVLALSLVPAAAIELGKALRRRALAV